MYFPIRGTCDPGERLKGLKAVADDTTMKSGDITLKEFIAEHGTEIVGAFISKDKIVLQLDGLGTAEFEVKK